MRIVTSAVSDSTGSHMGVAKMCKSGIVQNLQEQSKVDPNHKFYRMEDEQEPSGYDLLIQHMTGGGR